jgi:hypothetical protein
LENISKVRVLNPITSKMLDFHRAMLSHQLFGTSKYFHFEKGFRESQEFCCALILSPWGHAKPNYKENDASCNLKSLGCIVVEYMYVFMTHLEPHKSHFFVYF